MEHEVRVCPICKTKYRGYPAISRQDNRTEICQICGVLEALQDYERYERFKKITDTLGNGCRVER
jgi:hypothetical protein